MLSLILVVVVGQQVPSTDVPATRGYVQGSALVTIQPAGTAVHPFGEGTAVSPPLGGTTWSIAAGAGRFLDGVLTTTYPSPRQQTMPEYSERDDVLNLGGGLDFPVRTNRSVAIVPGFRLRWVHRINDALSSSMGTGGLRIEAGAGIRGSFDRREFQPVQRGPAYLQGGFVFASHPAGTANHRVSPPLGGETFGLSASGGAFVTPAVAIEGELVIGRTLSAPQRFSYNWRTDYTAGVRDLMLGGNARLKPGEKGPIEIVLGGGVAVTRLSERDAVTTYIFYPNQATEHPPDYEVAERAPYASAGADVPVRLGSRGALVPAFRWRWIFREPEGQSAYMGVGRQVFQAAVSVRVRL